MTDAGGVGEYLESFSLMFVCVFVGYICVMYAVLFGHEEDDAASSYGGTLS